jgi:cyanophycin synthetase
VQQLAEFIDFATARALPLDTRVLIDAASRAGIPWLKVDRMPFKREDGKFRIRPNSPLKLGHGCHQHIVDGNFCVDLSSAHSQLLSDREEVIRFMQRSDLPLPGRDGDSQNCSTLSRARRSAGKLGYPVALKPIVKSRGHGVSLDIRDEAGLRDAFEQAREYSRRVVVERHLPGNTYKLIIANRQMIAVVHVRSATDDTRDVSAGVHPSIRAAALRAASALDIGLLVFTLVATDIGLPLGETGAAFVDMDVAPALDAFLPAGSPLLAAASAQFIEWLFPPGSASRIPLVAVTGTNGKTTTSRMIRAILEKAGFRPGLACSEGVYVGGQQPILAGDRSGLIGHYQLLADPAINCAVLETARGGLLKRGFGFDHCDVAVCLNVTRDHLEDCGINTVEQMATLKRSIVQRARQAVVLSADDPRCLAMAPFSNTKRLCLVSIERSIDDLRALAVQCDCYVVTEEIEGEEQLVLYDRDRRLPIVPGNNIPATHRGMARYNLSNALHACAACHLLDIGIDTGALAAGLEQFEMNFDNTPGRLNFYDGLPFRILLDYAHNPDGITRLCAFVDKLPAQGRKIVAFSAASYNPTEIIQGNAQAVAGHFDCYFCYNFLSNIKQEHLEIPSTLRATLLAQEVAPGNIFEAANGLEAIDRILQMAEAGDLVVFLSGHSDRREIWERITTHA